MFIKQLYKSKKYIPFHIKVRRFISKIIIKFFFSDIDNIFDFKIAEFTKKKLNKNLKN